MPPIRSHLFSNVFESYYGKCYREDKKKGIDNGEKIECKDLMRVKKLFYEIVTDKIFYEGECFCMPYYLGAIRVINQKINHSIDEYGKVRGALINWGETRKHNKRVYFTDNFVYTIKYFKKHGLYKFRIIDTFRNKLAKFLMEKKNIPQYFTKDENYFKFEENKSWQGKNNYCQS